MGVSTVTAARIFKGQSQHNFSGEESVMFWEQFPHVSLSKTYGLDAQTSDSANSATAYLCGVKANIGTVGVDSTVKVIMGGGRKVFFSNKSCDEEGKPGARSDNENLILKWQELKENASAVYVWNRTGLLEVNTSSTEYLLGLFDNDHMPYWINRSEPGTTKPNLTEMVKVAVEILSRNPRGFVLLAEGGRIDHAHHANRAKLAMQETMEFEEAVNRTTSALPDNETLIVVTADHSHTMTIAGHPPRGTNIFGFAGKTTSKTPVQYTVISYGVGPQGARTLTNMTEEETASIDFVQQAAFPLWSAPHGGEDVAVYARGPWAHLFDGVNDQTYIPYVMAYAACIGQFNGSECHECLK
ncbi:hypothetical protein V5799_030256 [Amblyomma americanum]|uniref:alkaline phosphatase n=1 Tax=Amblyomma americanum TaxID=6943 RepID=A0AAQ4ENR8_AMBAM